MATSLTAQASWICSQLAPRRRAGTKRGTAKTVTPAQGDALSARLAALSTRGPRNVSRVQWSTRYHCPLSTTSAQEICLSVACSKDAEELSWELRPAVAHDFLLSLSQCCAGAAKLAPTSPAPTTPGIDNLLGEEGEPSALRRARPRGPYAALLAADYERWAGSESEEVRLMLNRSLALRPGHIM